MNAGTRLAFLGGGNMAWALIQGLLRQALRLATVRRRTVREATRPIAGANLECGRWPTIVVAVRDATLVVLAVKPEEASSVLADAVPGASQCADRCCCRSSPACASPIWPRAVADLPILRAMPNRPALVGTGATALYARAAVDRAARALAEEVCAAVGITVWVRREADLDIVTALSGSGPAYFFQLDRAPGGGRHRPRAGCDSRNAWPRRRCAAPAPCSKERPTRAHSARRSPARAARRPRHWGRWPPAASINWSRRPLAAATARGAELAAASGRSASSDARNHCL